jgi:lysophospholipase L1-like esterase
VRTNMTVVYDQLRAAAPNADIIYLVPHNFTITDFPGSNPSWAALDLEMRALAAAHRVQVADAFAAITLAGRTCQLTFMCLPPDQSDIHPNDAGYGVMAQLIFQAAHYNHR